MRPRNVIVGVYLGLIIILVIVIVALAIQLKNAKQKIINLENNITTSPTTTSTTTSPTTTTIPNLKPSSLTFDTNTWLFDKTKPTCTEVIPLTIRVPVQNPEKCSS